MDKFNTWFEGEEQKLSARDKSLVKKAYGIIEGNICDGEEYPWYPYRCIKPFTYLGEGYEWSIGLWNWDSAFHALCVMKWDIELAKEQILGFTQYQLDDGMFIDCIRKSGEIVDYACKPPFFAYATEKIFNKDNDLEFVKTMYPRLLKNEEFWTRLRFYKGLFHYGGNITNTPFEKLLVAIRDESGWDNSVRWDKYCSELWSVDLNCDMILHYRSLASLAGALGKTEDKRKFLSKEKELTENVEKYLWNEELHAYTDRNRFNLEYSDVLSPASFMPLFIQTASIERANYMERLAADKTKFFPGMPTVTYDNPNFCTKYWRGNTWLNVAYFAAKGLKIYGFDKTADAIKETILGWVENDGEYIHENYDSVTGKGLYCPKFSWSSVFVIEFITNWNV